jgi:23S rRNA pseudouridine1911/1915/1917 synthase
VSDQEWQVDVAAAGARLDKFLAAAERLGSRGRAAAALERGKIFHNDRECTLADAAHRLVDGDRIRLWMNRPGSSRKQIPRAPRRGELPIVYEDDALIVVNKPAGLLTVRLERREDAPSVQDALADYLRGRRRRPFVVHRIDRDTSGLVVFAIRPDAQARLRDQFRRREPERVYLTVVYGHPDPPSGTWRDHMVWDEQARIQKETDPRDPRAQEARARYRVIERFEEASLLEVTLITGRRNQIRLQARLRGHTLVGEQRYTYGANDLRPIEFARQALHAARLAFRHPDDGRELKFEAPVPPDLSELLAHLRGKKAPKGKPFLPDAGLIK